MGFFSSIDDYFTSPRMAKLRSEADEAKTAADTKKLIYQSLLNSEDARVALNGGTSPKSSITWDTGRQAPDPSTYQAQDDNGQFQRYNLLSGPQSSNMTPGVMSLLKNSPRDFQQNQQELFAQADPDAAMKARADMSARQSRLAAIDAMPGLPDNVKQSMRIETLGDSNTAKAMAKNLETPDAVKEVNSLIADLGKAQPGTDEYKAKAGILAQKTQNLPLMQLRETMRHNQAEEGNGAIVMTTDANGMPAYFDKRNKQTISILPDPFSTAAPATPAAGAPAAIAQGGGATIPAGMMQPVGASAADEPVYDATAATDRSPERRPWLSQAPAGTAPGQVPPQAPALVYQDEYIKHLAPESQAKFASLPPAIQFQLGPILAGKTSPPESGRAQTDPQLKNILRMAAMVDPNFNEQTWRERNKAAVDFADTKSPGSAGGQLVAARTFLGHATDLLDAAAGKNNTSILGTVGNAIDNAYVNHTAPGTIGNSTAKKTVQNQFGISREGVAEELGKIISGGAPTVDQRKTISDQFGDNADVSSIAGGVGEAADMMAKRIQARVDSYNKTMGAHETLQSWLGPEAYKQYQVLTKIASDSVAGKQTDVASVKKAIASIKAGDGGNPGITPVQTIVDELRRRGAIK